MSNLSAIAELDRRIDEQRRQLAAQVALRNSLLPELPADLTADLEDDEQATCPHLQADDTACNALLYAYADTQEVSPVLGWGEGNDLRWEDGRMVDYGTVNSLWVGDYDWADSSDPISEVRCGRGHRWQVPEHTDRNV